MVQNSKIGSKVFWLVFQASKQNNTSGHLAVDLCTKTYLSEEGCDKYEKDIVDKEGAEEHSDDFQAWQA